MFEMTSEGYRLAKQYLVSIHRYNRFMNNYTSTDGYSLIAYANSLSEKQYDNTK